MASSSIISRHSFKSECFSISFNNDRAKPYFASSFADKTLRIWNLNDIVLHGKALEEVSCEVPGAVELGPVDTQVCGNRVGTSSMDGSLKVYEIHEQQEQLTASLLADSNITDSSETQQPYDASKMEASNQFELDPWKFCFNPTNNS